MKPFFKHLPIFKDLEAPLSWSQLSHQKVRLVVATTGVCFANILMFTQIGLKAMLSDGTTLLHEKLGGDLILSSSFAPSLLFGMTFPRAYLIQAATVKGVKTASPLYLGSANWVNPATLKPRSSGAQETEAKPGAEPEEGDGLFGNRVRIIAFNPAQPVLNLPEVNQQLNQLTGADTVLFDRLGQASLGEIPTLLKQRSEVSTIMGNQRTYVVGLFSLGSSLYEKGNVIMSDWNYSRRENNALDRVTLGIIQVEPGVDPLRVQAQLQAIVPPEITVYTRQAFIDKEKKYQDSEPNGVVLNFGAIVGFVVGLIIVYQVLYADINDHLSEYATLKAMGYSDRVLLVVILQEAIILAILGFIPGYLASLGIYQLLVTLTRIPLFMKTTVAIQVFLLTLFMCAASGAIASGRLRSADPADVF